MPNTVTSRVSSLGIESPVAVSAALAEQLGAVIAQMAFELAPLHAAMVSSSDSLSEAGVDSACSPKRNSSNP